jgi:hypothetical protein
MEKSAHNLNESNSAQLLDPSKLQKMKLNNKLETIIENFEYKKKGNRWNNQTFSNQIKYVFLLILKDRSKFQLFRMGFSYFGIELLFSIEVALAVPILLKLKVSEK